MSAAEGWRAKWRLHTPDSLRARVCQLNASDYLIKGLLPARSIGVLVGDSGLGKSPLVYQAGVCVAAGLPFLNSETRKGSVVIADFENGMAEVSEILQHVSRHEGLAEPPNDNLFVWTLNDCPARYGQPGHTLIDMLRDVRPALAIIDSLGSYDPDAEEKNSAATRMLQEFRGLMRECGTASLFVHHRRKLSAKPGDSAGPLENAALRQWFQDARGASALINGTDIRLGVDAPDSSAAAKDDVALVLRGFGRVRGEIGPLYLARDVDETGEPVGYHALTGPELLMNRDQEHGFRSLPSKFNFAEAKRCYGRSDQPTRNWLLKCINVGIVRQAGRGSYEKAEGQWSK